MRYLILATLLSLTGCAVLSASEKLEGVDLLKLVEKENAAGCVNGWINGSHLGASGMVHIIATWGTNPPDCSKAGP